MADEPLKNEALDEAWAEALAEADADNQNQTDNQGETGPEEKAATEPTASPKGEANLDFLLDIPLDVSVELGRSSMIINKMLHLSQGSVIELDKEAGEPVDIYVNQKLLGKGEVIVVNDRYGVRITEIISQTDRIKNIGQ